MIIPTNIITNKGFDLADLASQNPVLLVFLRQFSCLFCKESLHELAKLQDYFLERSIDIVFVHMDTEEVADKYFKKFKLKMVQHISDPSCNLYQEFGLRKGSISQLFGLKTWIRGYEVNKKGIHLSLIHI